MKELESTFLDFVGDSPHTRLLEFLITGRELDYSLSDLAENAEIGWTTIHRILPLLEKNKIIVKTRTIGRAKLFRLNEENESVKKLILLYDSLLKKELEEKSMLKTKIIKTRKAKQKN